MPERRSHTKSRSGCAQCKLRRVKCNEEFPTCSACRKRQAVCVYDANQTKQSPHSDQGTPKTSSSSDPSDLSSHRHLGVDLRTHRAELELIYQWTTSTYATISYDAAQRLGTQDEMTRSAIQHDFLLDALFALTCLHLAFLRPKDAQTLIDDALRYQTKAVTASRRSLANLSASECRPHFHCSALLGMCSLALHAIDSQRTASEGPVDVLISLSQLWRGSGTIMAVSHNLLDEAAYERMFPPGPSPKVPLADGLDAEPNVYVSRLEAAVQTRGADTAAYLTAISSLVVILRSARSDDKQYLLEETLKWAPLIPATFVNQLCNREPLACAIALVYAAVFKSIELQWWVRGYSKALAAELAPIVSEAKPEWTDLVEWSKRCTMD